MSTFRLGGVSKSQSLVPSRGTAVSQVSSGSPPDPIEERTVALSSDVQSQISDEVMRRMNIDAASKMQPDEMVGKLEELINHIVEEQHLQVNAQEQRAMALLICDDMLGTGPLEPLMRDEGVTDIMINGPDRVFIEKRGRLVLTKIRFRNETHLREIAGRIARNVGRKLDEASPLVDARLPDGSRVNIVIPPIAIDGTSLSIRRFSKSEITLDTLMRYNSMSEKMKQFLTLAAQARLNILISGGTSSGKTTLLNAISRNISDNERVVTIEDAAELRLQQPHVVRLETRPTRGEGAGENIDQGRLVANALRMRPDRIILGEVRSKEAWDLLQAMNTGHDGSYGTLHANTPRDALSRLENMIMMAGMDLPSRAIRNQIAGAVDIVVQAERMIDGIRRVSKIIEVTGIEGETISTQDLFYFEIIDQKQGKLTGEFVCSNAQLRCRDKLRRAGLEEQARKIFSANTGVL